MRPRPLIAIALAVLSLSLACGPATPPFERVEMTAPAQGLFGAAKADVWGQVRVASTTTLAHSTTLKSWSAVSLAAEGSTVEPFLTSTAAAGANLAWVVTSSSTGVMQLVQVSSKGVSEDHTGDLPTGVSPLQVMSSAKGDVLWVVGTTGSGQSTRAKLFVRQGGALVEQPAMPEAISLSVLAVVSTDEAWVWWAAPLGGAPKPKVFHVKGGAFTDATWPTDSAPKLTLGPSGQAWLWSSSGNDGVSGRFFDGSTFASWKATNWPVQDKENSVVHFAFSAVAKKAGQVSLLTHATDYNAKQATERDSFRVVTVDASGNATPGPTLATCLTADECSAGDAVLLGDGTIIIPASKDTVVYRGDASAVP